MKAENFKGNTGLYLLDPELEQTLRSMGVFLYEAFLKREVNYVALVNME